MQKIIYVDDDARIGQLVKDFLEINNYEVTVVNSYDELNQIDYTKFDLMLLDIMLPGTNGIDICRILRGKIDYPIVFLSALGMEDNFVTALDSGGDDYITKPFSLNTLKAKIDSHLRREQRTKPQVAVLTSKNVSINKNLKRVVINNKIADFPKKEYQILEKFIENSGRVINKEQLFESIWGYDSDSDLTTVTEHIKRIRGKLADYDPDFSYIQTKYGLGYLWEPRYER